MSEQKMVTIPWHDGTTREVPEDTPCYKSYVIVFARAGGYTIGDSDTRIFPWGANSVSKVYVEAPEPPAVVEVPIGIGAVVASAGGCLYVRHQSMWRRGDGACVQDLVVRDALRQGGRVLSEGIDSDKLTEQGALQVEFEGAQR